MNISIPDAQQFFLLWHEALGGAPLCYDFSIRGPLHIEKLERSIQTVINANPILQSIYVPSDRAQTIADVKVSLIGRGDQFQLDFRDLQGQSESCQKGEIEREYHRLLNKKSNLSCWPLFECIVFHLGANQFHFFLGIDHVISDGLSSLEILHQIFSCYMGEKLSQQSQEDYNFLVSKVSGYEPDPKDVEKAKMFSAEVGKQIFFWNPENRGSPSESFDYETCVRVLSREETEQLLNCLGRYRGSLYSILVAVYSEMLVEDYSTENFVLALPTSGRIYPEIDLRNTIGCFAQSLTIQVTSEQRKIAFQERVRHLNSKIQSGLEAGVDKVLTKNLGKSLRKDFPWVQGKLTLFTKFLFRSSIKTNLYVSFTGRSPLRGNYGDLAIFSYREGTFNNPGAFDFMHTIFDSQLHLFANYDSSYFSRDLADQILDRVKQRLKNVTGFSSDKVSLFSEKRETEDRDLLEKVISLINTNLSLKLSKSNLSDDLEGTHGVDSLAKIRLVTEVYKSFGSQLNRSKLLESRTLAELVNVIQQRQDYSEISPNK